MLEIAPESDTITAYCEELPGVRSHHQFSAPPVAPCTAAYSVAVQALASLLLKYSSASETESRKILSVVALPGDVLYDGFLSAVTVELIMLFCSTELNAVFKNRVTQWLFSLLHPWIAFRLGNGWSRRSRLARGGTYVFNGTEEPLYKWAEEFSSRQHVDAFIFGHLHCEADLTLPSGARLIVLKDWMEGGQCWYFDGILTGVGHSMNTE